jgi:hypothetical protein
MRIKHDGNVRIMSELIACPNYGDMKHFDLSFEDVGDYAYKCNTCGTVITFLINPSIIHEENGRLKVQVLVGTKER